MALARRQPRAVVVQWPFHRSTPIRSGRLAWTVVALLGAVPALAQQPEVPRDEQTVREQVPFPDGDALALAKLYASGRRAEAIARLEGWSEAAMKAELATLRRQMRKTRGSLPEGLLRAAVMLHTDREAYERLQVPVVESARRCGIDRHAAYARALVPLLIVQSDATRDFARRWLTAMALSSHWDLCLDDVRRWTGEGLKWFPKDALLLLIQGTASETAAALTPPPMLFTGDRDRREGLVDLARRRQSLNMARRDLEAALALDPALDEARLRLGRVLWRLESGPEARPPLQAVAERTRDPRLAYLAQLFLGRVMEDAGDLPGAIEWYRAALAVDPAAQAAAMALSEALVIAGESAEGREVLGHAVQQAPRPQPRDAYLSYHLGRADQAEGMLEALRGETLR